jgi:hypothetical protein
MENQSILKKEEGIKNHIENKKYLGFSQCPV